jgi:hypothetical protein
VALLCFKGLTKNVIKRRRYRFHLAKLTWPISGYIRDGRVCHVVKK